MRTRIPDLSGPRAIVAALAALSLASAGGLEAQEHARRASEVARRAYSEGVAEQVRELVGRARQSGLPPRALADRTLEAAAKGVAGDRLLEGLSERLVDLRRSARALGPAADAASVKAGATALSESLVPDDLRRVGRMAPGPERPAALLVVAELKSLGLPVGRALEAVEGRLARGEDARDLLLFGARVRSAARRGLSPGEALHAVRRPAAGARGPGPPSGARTFGGGAVPGGPPVPQGAGPPADAGPPDDEGEPTTPEPSAG